MTEIVDHRQRRSVPTITTNFNSKEFKAQVGGSRLEQMLRDDDDSATFKDPTSASASPGQRDEPPSMPGFARSSDRGFTVNAIETDTSFIVVIADQRNVITAYSKHKTFDFEAAFAAFDDPNGLTSATHQPTDRTSLSAASARR